MKTSSSSSKRDLLSMQDLSAADIQAILKLAAKLKKEQKAGKARPLLRGKTLGMIFQKPSTRTRVSFEVGMSQLGGSAIYLGSTDIQLARGETIEDTAKTLSRYVDCLMARVYDHADVQKLAASASIPVINGLSDAFHPCQILADLLTIREHKKKLEGLRMAWLGDGDNVCNDLLLAAAKTGISMAAACPAGYEPLEGVVKTAKAEGKKTGAEITVTADPATAAKDADIVVTDTFISIGKEGERATRESVFLPKYQVNAGMMRLAKKDAIFMHCLPAKRGQEVTADVIDGPQSVVWDEAENRLHAQKAVLCMLMKKAA
ncbi:ornithine carbamoyltransferase [Nitrososphaera viennensis]|uniref:Ornithine carbamoyltransferase n=1 Tax=Nitrososphaera viennensis TaxID=1034015 RepID=A0A977NM98_9ARCH|nr:ornithine carbamoyltransferase [Nitrososphaera viennensis]UVS69171.1 ornithine carbamoyltransferase [Nitrososphaera viennensis]